MGYLDDKTELTAVASDDVLPIGDTDDLHSITGKRTIKWVEKDNLFGQGLGVGDSPEFLGLTVDNDNGGGTIATIAGGALKIQRTDGGAANVRQSVEGGGAGAQSWLLAVSGSNGDWSITDETASNKILVLENGAPANSLRVDADGNIGVGLISPSAQLHVDQSSESAAKPPLLLDQADESEQMITFTSTVGVGNAIEAVGAKSLTITHFIKVTITGVGDRYIPVGTIA